LRDARVVLIDNDAVVLARLRALVAHGDPGVTAIEGDVREAPVILDAVGAAVDLARPACLVMGAFLHFFPPDAARDLVAGYAAAVAPGQRA
jgi:O-methyltransferase involved in polyketide biosynthesis